MKKQKGALKATLLLSIAGKIQKNKLDKNCHVINNNREGTHQIFRVPKSDFLFKTNLLRLLL